MTRPILTQKRLYQQLAEHIAERIRSGEFPAGKALPGENALAREYGVGRNVMREALVALELLGLVAVRAGAGAFVTNAAPHIEASLGSISAAGGPSPLAILEARRAIEGEVAFHAAIAASDEDIAALEALVRLVEAGSSEEIEAANWPTAFHIGLARASGNPVFETIVEALWQAVQGPMFAALRSHVSLEEVQSRLATRRRILEAVRDRDAPVARAAMHAHVDTVIRDLFGRNEASRKKARHHK